MSDKLEVRLAGPQLTPEKFVQAVQHFFALVEGVSRNMFETPLNWTVEVATGSAIVRVRSDDPKSERTVEAVTKGVRSLRSGAQTAPKWFTKDEVRAARALATIADGVSITSVQIKNGASGEDVSSDVVKTADAILMGERTIAYGSVEGVLDAVSVRGGFTCGIFEPNYHRPITCSFNKKELEQEAYKAFTKRVLISGMVRYGKEGYPTSIDADRIRVFPDESELPSVEEIQAIYKEIYE